MEIATLSDREIEMKLLKACRNGSLPDVIDIVRKVDPSQCEAKDRHGDTPLHAAAFKGHLSIVKLLIQDAKCDPESLNAYKNTPLHCAANRGHLEVVKYLIEEQNCNPMCVCHWNRTPLHNACRHGRIEVVKYLLSNTNVNVSVRDSVQGSTALHLAAEFGTLEIVQYIMKIMEDSGTKQKSDLKEDTPQGAYTHLHLAAYGGKLDIVKYLVKTKGYDIMIKSKRGRTPLYSACAGCQLEVVKYLVDECQADFTSSCCDNHSTPLDIAAEHDAFDIVKYLVEEKHCKVEHGIEHKNTALHHAAYGGSMKIVRYLIEDQKCSPSCKGRNGGMPLHSACNTGRMEIVNYLIKKCEVDASNRDHKGITPLHIAAKYDHLELIKQLITIYDCDWQAKDNSGKTPKDYAYERKHSKTIDYLNSVTTSTLVGATADDKHKYLFTQLKPYARKAKPTGIVLGSGTYGSVIELVSAGETLAGKTFRMLSTVRSEAIANKVCGEVIMMLQLDHPNIVKCKGVSLLEGQPLPVLLMECLMNSLHAYILHVDNHNLPVNIKVSILLDTASGLDYLHSRTPAIIHRDLTAHNVLLDSELRAKIADFGNSRIMDLDPDCSPETLTGLPGTPEYMPPEALGTYDPSLDVFSFGHLSLFTIIQTPIRPLLPANYNDSIGKLHARSEVKRREKCVTMAEQLLSKNHSLVLMIKQCLHNIPAQRPRTGDLVTRLSEMMTPSE